MGKSVAWPFVAICICGDKGRTASYDPQHLPCFHVSLNKNILIIGQGTKWRWRSFINHHKISYGAAQNYSNYAYAYYTRVFCVYAYVYTRTYTRIYVRIYPFVMHPPSFFMQSIVWQTKDSSGMKKREASTRNLHSVKNVNESSNISSFRLLHKFTNKLPFINNCLIFSCQKVSRKIETVAWFPYITILFSFILNIACVCREIACETEMFIVWSVARPCWKN